LTSSPDQRPAARGYPLTAIVSDIHSNRQALGSTLADAARRGVRRYVCLGDVVGYGAAPLECLDRIMQVCGVGAAARATDVTGAAVEPGLCLLGNHEQALLESPEDFNPRARAAIEWTRSAIAAGGDAYWDFVGGLVPCTCDEVAQFVHGSPRDPVKEYVLPSDVRNPEKYAALFAPMQRSICFVGHSHVPAVYYDDQRFYRPRDTEGPYRVIARAGERVIINVGSVGQPRDGDVRASYALFDGENVTFVRLEYDVAGAQAEIRGVTALPEYLAERLSQGR
jgi:diadenosine tetraphosphatase ApaH/serine/threonine PP2A family protein phosphatase